MNLDANVHVDLTWTWTRAAALFSFASRCTPTLEPAGPPRGLS